LLCFPIMIRIFFIALVFCILTPIAVSANGIIDDSTGDINDDVFPLFPYYVIFVDETLSSDPTNAWTGAIISSADYPPPIDYTVQFFETQLGLNLTNTYWLSFDTLEDIETYCGVPLAAPGNRDTCLANTTGINSYSPLPPTPPVISTTTYFARIADSAEAFVLSWYFALGFVLVLAVFILFPTRTRYDY